MADLREDILQRLRQIAGKVKGVSSSARMEPASINTEEGPALVLFDGAERALDDDKPRDGRVPALYVMRPELHIFLQGQASEVGKLLNKIRTAAISAVVFDESLRELIGTGRNGTVRYLGCETSAERGRAAEADMSLVFEITYVFKPQQP